MASLGSRLNMESPLEPSTPGPETQFQRSRPQKQRIGFVPKTSRPTPIYASLALSCCKHVQRCSNRESSRKDFPFHGARLLFGLFLPRPSALCFSSESMSTSCISLMNDRNTRSFCILSSIFMLVPLSPALLPFNLVFVLA